MEEDWPEYFTLRECEEFLDGIEGVPATQKKEMLREQIKKISKRDAPEGTDSVKALERFLLAQSHA